MTIYNGILQGFCDFVEINVMIQYTGVCQELAVEGHAAESVHMPTECTDNI